MMALTRRERAAFRYGRYRMMCDLHRDGCEVQIARNGQDIKDFTAQGRECRLWYELAVERWPQLVGLSPQQMAWRRAGFTAAIDDEHAEDELSEQAMLLLEVLPTTPERSELETWLDSYRLILDRPIEERTESYGDEVSERADRLRTVIVPLWMVAFDVPHPSLSEHEPEDVE
jgi:hypothetical protein